MYFILVFIVTFLFTLLFYKFRSRWVKWVPAMIFFIATIIMVFKATFFPAPEMAVLGEIVYSMIFASMTIAALVSGLLIHFWKRKQNKG